MTESSETILTPSTTSAVGGLIGSMCLVALSSGLVLAYLPVKIAYLGLEPWVSGAMLTSMAGGGLLGCLLAGPIIKRAGHARAFASFTAIVILSMLALTGSEQMTLWLVARGAYGVAATGLFIVTQSWLNDACENDSRGRVIALFYMSYVLCIGGGGYLIRYVDINGSAAPTLSAALAALAVIPVALTRLTNPPPPEAIHIAFRSVWKISPVGLAGLLAVGGLTMLVQGFAPIYAAAEGFDKHGVAVLLLLMPLGMLVVQLPLGALSDRVDRRYMLVLASILVAVCATAAPALADLPLMLWIILFALWSGATESIFAIANAHANDRAAPQYYVSVASTLLVAWSVSGLILPGIATLLTNSYGPAAFTYLVGLVAVAYTLFVVHRIFQRDPAPEAAQEPFQPMSAQAPLSAEWAPQPDGSESIAPHEKA